MNASWESVQELEKLVTGDDFMLVTHEIPVEYDSVMTMVPSLWKQYQPKVGNKIHGLGAMYLKEIIKTNHVQLKSRISCQWFTQNVF